MQQQKRFTLSRHSAFLSKSTELGFAGFYKYLTHANSGAARDVLLTRSACAHPQSVALDSVNIHCMLTPTVCCLRQCLHTL